MVQTLSKKLFDKVFAPGLDPALDEVDLTITHYAPYAERINESIGYLRTLDWKKLTMTSFDGAELVAHMHDVGSESTIVICHGYKSHYFGNTSCAGKFFAENDYNIIQIVSRGHGESGGDFITFGEHESKDLLMWLEKFEKELGLKKMIVYGISLGSNTVMRASEFIDSKAVKALILDCGFSNTRQALIDQLKRKAKPQFRGLLVMVGKPYIKKLRNIGIKSGGFDIYEGNTAESIKKSKLPSFFIHGKKDSTVPIDNTIRNYEACPNKKEMYISENADHGAGFAAGGQELEEKLMAFLKECGM